ncbi:Crp/Fnr family transcriptional regulator [Myxosarcina sp. GI1]|uniref:Crp/Fnr family transcriptional regulator n=1 Tax=Myxosarcina sp. GI1 TaxID=1541065 RepID=UPI000566948B|nr:Crp/Fnr family transcriptional regulator [Myxosarcina sp. GI1]
MHFSDSSSETSRPFSTWQSITDWAQEHYRDRIFNKDERIPTRPELIYLVGKGAIRLVGTPAKTTEVSTELSDELIAEAFLGFVGAGQPFETVEQAAFVIQAYAHVDRTQVIWLYWRDLENWPHFRQEVERAFRYQHQRKLLWLTALGQRKTIDRLASFLMLLIEEYGKAEPQGYCLPYTLTHAQIGSAIGSTRVTVTRLMGKLRRQGLIFPGDDNSICIPKTKLDRGL